MLLVTTWGPTTCCNLNRQGYTHWFLIWPLCKPIALVSDHSLTWLMWSLKSFIHCAKAICQMFLLVDHLLLNGSRLAPARSQSRYKSMWQFACHNRRRQEQGAWPPDWGHGDASRFPDFPELPKSRAKLVPPTESRHKRRSGSGTSGRRLPLEAASRDESLHEQARRHAARSGNDDISSAELDGMVFRQQPP